MSTGWSKSIVNKWRQLFRQELLIGPYGPRAVKMISVGIDFHMIEKVQNGNVLVVGSQSPWVEAIILEKGARHITTLEYGSIASDHRQITTVTPSELNKHFLRYMNLTPAYILL